MKLIDGLERHYKVPTGAKLRLNRGLMQTYDALEQYLHDRSDKEFNIDLGLECNELKLCYTLKLLHE